MPTGLFDDLVEEPKQSQPDKGLFDDLVDRDEGTTLSGKYYPPEERKGITFQGQYVPSMYEMEKERETGIRKSLPKGAVQRFREGLTHGLYGGLEGVNVLTAPDNDLKNMLLSEQRKMKVSSTEPEPSFIEKGAEMAGGLAGTTVGAGIAQTGLKRAGMAGFFGASSARDAFLHSGLRALAEGKTPEEATQIAKKVSRAAAVIGATEGAVLPAGGGGSVGQVAKQAGIGAGIFGAGQAARNVTERANDLGTPILENVLQASGMGLGIPILFGGAGGVYRALLRKGARTPPPVPTVEPTPEPRLPEVAPPEVTQESAVPATQGPLPLPKGEPSGLRMVEAPTQPRPSEGQIKATPALLEQLPPGQLIEVPVSDLIRQPVERGPALAGVEELGQSIRRRTDFEKARAETVSQQYEAIVHPDKPLTDNQIGLIEDSLKRAILENQIPGDRPGIISGTKLEKWADKVMSEDVRGRLSVNPIDLLTKDIAALSIKGAAVLERGVRDYPAWSAEMAKLYGDEFKPILRKVYLQSLQVKGSQPYAIQRETAQVLQPVQQRPAEGQGQVPKQEGLGETGPRSEQPLQPGEGTQAQVPLTDILQRPVQEIAAAYESIPPDQITSFGVENFNRALGEKAKTPEDIAALKAMADSHSARITQLKKAGNFDEAIKLSGFQPMEAYKFATEGAKKGGVPTEKAQETKEAVLTQPQPASRGIAASAREAIASGVPRGTEAGFVRLPEGIDQTLIGTANKLAGKSAPRTSAASEESGNALVRYASSHIAAKPIARWMASEVLGGNAAPEFSERLGAVLVEDRLRAIKDSFERSGNTTQADKVGSVIGKDWSPLKSGADFEAALNDPAIQRAIEIHKATVQPEAQRMHEATEGVVAGPGLRTGAFVNLKAVLEDQPEGTFSGAFRGNLENPRHLKTKFGQKATGTAEEYELDYRTLAERMMEANYAESTKRDLHAQLVTDGLAKIGKPGDSAPLFRGQKGVRFTIERRGGKVEHLWVDPKIATEYRQAINTDGAIGQSAIATAANLLNKIQLAGPTDAVWHTANMISSIAGSQGGKNMLVDLARKIPGVNIVDAIGRVVAKGREVISNDPEIQRQLAEIARIGALRGEDRRGIVHNALLVIDRAGRLVRDDLYQNLVSRGLVDESEAGRREWINQMGQYNGRLMGQFERIAKEASLSPFIVAGRNFNRQALRRLSLSPGVKAANLQSAALMRGVELFGAASTLFLIPATFNFLTTGNVFGRPGTKLGQIDTGKDSGGKYIVIDPVQWIGLRRGLRITGVQSVAEGVREGKPMQEIRKEAIRDVIGGLVHPWAGPAVHAATTATTGYSPSLWKESKNPRDFGENGVAALKQLNPTIAALFEGHEQPGTTPVGRVGTSLAGAGGVKLVAPVTASQQVGNLVRSWMSKSQNPDIQKRFERSQEQDFGVSDYKGLRDALKAGDNKAAKEAFQELLKTKKGKDIYDAFRPKTQFTGSKALEQKFVSSLTPDQLSLYRKAKEERQQIWQKFQAVVK